MTILRKSAVLLLTVLLLCVPKELFAEMSKKQAADYNKQLSSSDTAVRVKATEEISHSPLATAGKEVLPLLSKAMQDSDPNVRLLGVSSFLRIAQETKPKSEVLKPGTTDIRKYEEAKPALLALIDDPNEMTRTKALNAYLLTYAVDPDLQTRLISLFAKESFLGSFQPSIIYALTIDGSPTQEAKELLVSLIADPMHLWMVAKAVALSVGPPVPELLPKFVEQMSAGNNQTVNGFVANAIKRYGPDAKPYLPRLVEVMSSQSSREGQESVEKIIATVDGSH